MKVLVTGGAGFIGRHVVKRLSNRADVVVLDNLRSGARENIDVLDCELVVGSILERELVRKLMRNTDYVFHLAAMVSVPESISEPEECERINVRGTAIVLEEASTAKVKKLVFSSSAAVYGDAAVDPKDERMPTEPTSPYGTSKLEGERLCARFTAEGSLDTVCLRYFNVFGPYQNPKSDYAAAVPAFISNALANRPIIVFGDGEQTRDFIAVNDVAAANVFFAMESAEVGTFNVASGQSITISELANHIRSLTHSNSKIEHVPPRAGDVRRSTGKIDKLHAAGFRPATDFKAALEKTIDYFAARTVS